MRAISSSASACFQSGIRIIEVLLADRLVNQGFLVAVNPHRRAGRLAWALSSAA